MEGKLCRDSKVAEEDREKTEFYISLETTKETHGWDRFPDEEKQNGIGIDTSKSKAIYATSESTRTITRR